MIKKSLFWQFCLVCYRLRYMYNLYSIRLNLSLFAEFIADDLNLTFDVYFKCKIKLTNLGNSVKVVPIPVK